MNLSHELAQRYSRSEPKLQSGDVICGITKRRCPNYQGIHSKINKDTGIFETVDLIGHRYPTCAGCPQETNVSSY